MYQACNESRRYPVGSPIRVPGAFPFDGADDRRVLPARNPRRDYSRRYCKSAPVAFHEPGWNTKSSRHVGRESISPHTMSPTGGARRLTPEFKLPSQTRSAHAVRPVHHDHHHHHHQPAMTSRVPPGAKLGTGPKPVRKQKAEWVPPPPVTLPISFNTKPVAAPRKSKMSRFFRSLCCC